MSRCDIFSSKLKKRGERKHETARVGIYGGVNVCVVHGEFFSLFFPVVIIIHLMVQRAEYKMLSTLLFVTSLTPRRSNEYQTPKNSPE